MTDTAEMSKALELVGALRQAISFLSQQRTALSDEVQALHREIARLKVDRADYDAIVAERDALQKLAGGLRESLADERARGGMGAAQAAHWPDCWRAGPQHYECAREQVERLRGAIAAAGEIVADIYGAGKCDCDYSVGIYSCGVCEIRGALEFLEHAQDP